MIKLGAAVLSVLMLTAVLAGVVANAQKEPEIVFDLAEASRIHKDDFDKVLQERRHFEQKASSVKVTNNDGIISNFEGPIVSFEYLNFHGRVYDTENHENREFFRKNATSVWFDPDHPDFGLPDLRIVIDKPRFKRPEYISENSKFYDKIVDLLPVSNQQTPYKHYEKSYATEDHVQRIENFDLYLTEFNLTLDIETLREEKISRYDLSEKVRKLKKYPAYWYNNTTFDEHLVSLDDINYRHEYEDSRYGDLDIVFKVTPNQAPWYVSSADGEQVNAEVAVGALIVTKLDVDRDEKRRLSVLPDGPGQYLTLYEDSTLGNRYDEAERVSKFNTTGLSDSIFNKDYYFRITSKNIGSWERNLGFDKWDDRVTFTFLLPILVKGTLDVILPSDVIPEYQPPHAYVKTFTLADLLPDWSLGGVGRYITYAFLAFIVVVTIILFPNIFVLFNTLLGVLISWTRRMKLPNQNKGVTH